MSDVRNSVEITLGYVNSEQTRRYTFNDVPDSMFATIKSAINAINSSLAAGTDDGMKEVFVADDVNTVTGDGYLRAIISAKGYSTQEIKIFGGAN